jgi:ferric-dicitrate binding protein FerR (iron transport regulator)
VAQNKSAQQAKRRLVILFGVILLAVIAAVVIGQIKQKQRDELMAHYSTATPESADVVEYGALVCDDCKAANMDINV